ncbi:MAG: ribbon-helix-helix domain-containing protein [Archaeoglobaceae archaeon]|nr:ribbon-helix-helix domain-containing protein [Archaeoglobaceae archaeon]MCX8151857.1 ribbon-helix-helix domain-containing protein [Archaeoglobaceae archaeon]MDW8014311.1 ribbon-helix-helix domain-containing protein [Archaeoglobaceae archaeon]
MPATRKISVRLTERQYEHLEILVDQGEYTSVSEAIRAAINEFIERKKEKIAEYARLKEYR